MPKKISDRWIAIDFKPEDLERIDRVSSEKGWDGEETIRELTSEGLRVLDGEALLLSDQLGLDYKEVNSALYDLKADAARGGDQSRPKTEADFVRAAVLEALRLRDLKAEAERRAPRPEPAAETRGRVLQLVSPPKREQ